MEIDQTDDLPSPTLKIPELHIWVERQVRSLTRQGVQKKTEKLVWMLSQSYFRLYPHKRPLSSPRITIPGRDQFFWGTSFHVKDLLKSFGGSHGNYKQYLILFWDFVPDNTGYDDGGKKKKGKKKRPGLTKVYVLKKRISKILDGFWSSCTSEDVIDKNTDQRITSKDLPINGICRTSYSTLTVPSLITFDRDRLDESICTEETQLTDPSGFPRYKRIQTLRSLYQVRKWIISFGGIPNLYQDYKQTPTEKNGRLYGIGELHLQRLKRDVRRIMYQGTGWWDYDFISCHLNIVQSLGRGYGVDTLVLDEYLRKRKYYNKRLSPEIGVPVDKMKRVVNSFLYGQPVSTSLYNSLYNKTLRRDKESLNRIRDHGFLTCLRCDLRNVRDEVIRRHTQGDEIVNVLEKRRSIYKVSNTGKLKKVSDRKLFSHILTGYEGWSLNTVCQDFTDVKVLLYDGWVCENQRDVSELEQRIIQYSTVKFGFPLRLRIKSEQYV